MAEYQGKDVELNQPMHGDVKKYKVYVKDPKTGNVKKVNFGDKDMEIKRDDPERRKAFRARHKCDQKKDKTKAGYWSCKFWSDKKVSDLLKEVIEPEDVDVSSIQYHDELNSLLWDEDDKIKEEVRRKLLEIAKRFIEFSDIEKLKFNDIILTGSMANYNYNEGSDIDLHIVLDYDQISANEEFVDDFLKMKKSIWNERYPIQIKGHDVELYYQDDSEVHHSTGTYSLMRNEWINEPTKKIINVDTDAIKLKGAHLIYEIEDLEDIKNSEIFLEKYIDLKDKIKKMRKSGLEKNGEFSVENLTFKVLRNLGYLDKLAEMKKEYLTKELTLNETTTTQEEVVTDDEIVEQILKRVPFLKEFNILKKKEDELLAQKVEYYKNKEFYNPNGDNIKLNNLNISSNFKYSMYEMGGNRKRYNFYLKNEFIDIPSDETSETMKTAISIIFRSFSDKSSYVKDIIIDTNKQTYLTTEEFNNIINDINKHLFMIEEYSDKMGASFFKE